MGAKEKDSNGQRPKRVWAALLAAGSLCGSSSCELSPSHPADGRDAGGFRSGGEAGRPRRLQPLLLLPGGGRGPVLLEAL